MENVAIAKHVFCCSKPLSGNNDNRICWLITNAASQTSTCFQLLCESDVFSKAI